MARRAVAYHGPKRTFAVTSPDGRRYTRTSSHPYTHVGFYFDPRDDRWYVSSWSSSADLARKSAQAMLAHGSGNRVAVIPVEGGQARRRSGHAATPHRHVHGRARSRQEILREVNTRDAPESRGFYGTGIRHRAAARKDVRRRFGSRPAETPVQRPGARFYVTARSGSRTAFLLGPYSSHMTAQSHVARGRQLAEERTREGQYGGIAYGTSSSPETVRTVFGR